MGWEKKPDWLKDWRKILLYALCTAVFFFMLYLLFAPSGTARYVVIGWRDNNKTVPVWYMDSRTGNVYYVKTGQLLSSPRGN